jgi:PAS domain S-box-containing protein
MQEVAKDEPSYRLLVDSLREGVAIISPAGKIEYCNGCFAKMLGLPQDRLLGQALDAFVASESSAVFLSLLTSCIDGKAREELALIASTGEKRIALAACKALELGASNGRGIVLTDITESKRLENKALRLNSLYATMSAVNQAIVHTVDRDSLFQDCCRAAVEQGGFRLAWIGIIDPETRLVGVSAAHGETAYLEGIRISAKVEPEGLGPTGRAVREGSLYICNDFLHSEVTRPWHERARRHGICSSASIVLRQGGAAIGALTLYSAEQDFFDTEHMTLVRGMGEDLSFGLDLLHDRELRRAAEQALIDQGRQAAMGAMIGNIAHQWRQPLTLLALTVQKPLLYLDRGDFDREKLEQSMNASMRLIRHMSQTIDDFRDFFRPNREKVEFSAREAIERSLSLLASALEALAIEVLVEPGEDLLLTGFPNEFSQALVNIIINAKDALEERKVPEPRIGISLRREGSKTVICIADNAGGIPAGIMGRIFEPYFTTKASESGTGLGLSMSKTIIERNMGGRLSVRNLDQGAEFRIEV